MYLIYIKKWSQLEKKRDTDAIFSPVSRMSSTAKVTAFQT